MRERWAIPTQLAISTYADCNNQGISALKLGSRSCGWLHTQGTGNPWNISWFRIWGRPIAGDVVKSYVVECVARWSNHEIQQHMAGDAVTSFFEYSCFLSSPWIASSSSKSARPSFLKFILTPLEEHSPFFRMSVSFTMGPFFSLSHIFKTSYSCIFYLLWKFYFLYHHSVRIVQQPNR